MPSPFPGMNPYLERHSVWANVHSSLITALRDHLAPLLRPRYFVAIEEHVYLHVKPDEPVLVQASRGGVAVLDTPKRARIVNAVEEQRVPYLAIEDTASRKVVTIIEILSPSNKGNGGDREQYLRKRHEILKSSASLVEIDLLRGGSKLPAEDFPECDYSVMVSRPETRPEIEVWPVMLRERLPVFPVPLRAGEETPTVDLQELLDHVYDVGALDLVAYDAPPEPPLSAEDAAWAESVLAQAASV